MTKKIFEISLCLLSWFALALQLSLLKDSFFNFISYFTILSNFAVAVSLTAALFLSNAFVGKYFSSVIVRAGIALNIFIVFLIYNTVLRGVWNPKGWQLVADNLLHVAVPMFYMMYWFLYVPKGFLNWKSGIQWAYFPLAYLIYSLIRGHVVNWYPYPFLNVTQFGYSKVFINAGFVLIAFALFGSVMIWIDGLKSQVKGESNS